MDYSENEVFVREKYCRYDAKRDFRSLSAWKKCREVKLFFYQRILSFLPRDEKYIIGSQIKKAALSITANIAEGYGRYHYREGIQFYRISRASLFELKDHLISCYDLAFISKKEFQIGIDLIESAKTTLNGYIKFVQSKLK